MSDPNPKLQTPIPKKTPNSKPEQTFLWDLRFGAFLELGIWDLGIF
jgi:hypothetical protein